MDNSKRLWEQSAASVANHVLWDKLRSRWAGVLSTSGVGAVIGLLTHFMSNYPWTVSALSGAIGGGLIWGLVYFILWSVAAPRIQRDAAKKHVDYLERRPTVELGNEAILEGSAYLIPATNHGPGNAKLCVQVTEITYIDGETLKSKILPVKFLRWRGGSGNHPEGTTNWEKVAEGETQYLHMMEITGNAVLSNGEKGKEARITAANSSDNYQFNATPGSKVKIDLQAIGEPNLANITMQSVLIEMPNV